MFLLVLRSDIKTAIVMHASSASLPASTGRSPFLFLAEAGADEIFQLRQDGRRILSLSGDAED